MVKTLMRQRLVMMVAAILLVGSVTFVSLGGGAQAAPETRQANQVDIDYFMKIDGIEGESTDEKHKGEIELTSFSWGDGEPGLQQELVRDATGGGGAGKVSVNDFSFVANTSKASPKLLVTSASGKHIKEATLTVRKKGKNPQDFYVVTMSDVLVSSYKNSGQDGSLPTDQVSLNFTKIEVEYKAQKADGSLDTPVKGGWDIKLNKAL